MMLEDIIPEEADQRSKWPVLVSRMTAMKAKEKWMSPTAILGPTKERTPRHALIYTVWNRVMVVDLDAQPPPSSL